MSDQAGDGVRTEIAQIIEALETGKYKRVRKRLRHMHPAKIASLIETLDDTQRMAVWQQVDATHEGRILAHLTPDLARVLHSESREPAPTEDDAATNAEHHATTQIQIGRAHV